jgi:hypothetical protein
MPRPRCVECHEIAETQWPHALCQAHAIIFYTTVVRVGSALAELERGAPSGAIQWEQQVIGRSTDEADELLGVIPRQGHRTCRIRACPFAPRTRAGTYCPAHLRQRRLDLAQAMVDARQVARRARAERQQWTS